MTKNEAEKNGVLLIISGPSGVGKSTICRRLEERLDAFLSVSATTRSPREGEAEGHNYRFMTIGQFEDELERGAFLEYARVYGGHYYGTPIEPVQQALAAGKVVILEIEIEGTIQVMDRYPDAIGVYIMAPTPVEQKNRIVGRKRDSAEAMAERLKMADGEIRYAKDCGAYHHFLVNESVQETVDAVVKIVSEKQQA
ncbi:MAG: guanylate kinase [Planctomycetota bacterium]|nr:MAG: guanylate kinase [Planctomycetota bacterium]